MTDENLNDELTHEEDEHPWLENARKLIDEEKNDAAIKELDSIIEKQADYAEAYFYRGNAYGNKGDVPQSVLDYNKALELKPDFELAAKGKSRIVE